MASDHPFLSAEQLTLVAFLKAKPSHGEELGQRLLTLFEKARAEEGNINYDLHQSTEDPHIWMLYANWRSPTDLEAYFALPYMQEFISSLSEVLDGEMDLRRFSMRTAFVAPKGASASD